MSKRTGAFETESALAALGSCHNVQFGACMSSQRGKVVFHRYGNRYFLSEVWIGGESTGRVCVQSRAEKRLQIAQNAPVATNTELALNAPVR